MWDAGGAAAPTTSKRDHDIARCAISQYDLREHTCGPATYRFTQGMSAFCSKSTRHHNTASWRVCGAFEFCCRQDAKKVADRSQKCAFCQATKKQMQGTNKLQAMTADSAFVEAGLHRAGQLVCKNCARENRPAAVACLASADAQQSDEVDMAPAAPAANATDETMVRSYRVWHTICSMPNYSLSFVYCKTCCDYIVARYFADAFGARCGVLARSG